MTKPLAVFGAMTLAAVLLPAAALARDTGFYVGADIGKSFLDVSKNNIDNDISTALNDAEVEVVSGSSNLDDSDTTFGLHVGYRFMPYLAAEVSYLDFGSAQYSGRGVITDLIEEADLKAGLEAEFSGFALSALGILPINDQFEVYGRAGVLFGKTEANARVTFGNLGESGSISDSKNSEDLLLGIGGTWNFAEQLSARLEFQRVFDAGDDESVGEADLDRLTLGVTYSF